LEAAAGAGELGDHPPLPSIQLLTRAGFLEGLGIQAVV